MDLADKARPFPVAGGMRNDQKSLETPVLSWLGPWQANAFVGVLEEDGRIVDNPPLVGMRLSINPAPGLEIAASRMMQICRKGRSCGAGTWVDAVTGRDNTGDQSDTSTPLAGRDAGNGHRNK